MKKKIRVIDHRPQIYNFNKCVKFKKKSQMKKIYDKLFKEGKYFLKTGYTDIEPYPGWYILMAEIKEPKVFLINDIEEINPRHDTITDFKKNYYR